MNAADFKTYVFPLLFFKRISDVHDEEYQTALTESGGEWSMAQYIKAVETEDESLRRETMDSIRKYNREDLEATWAVMHWLRKVTSA